MRLFIFIFLAIFFVACTPSSLLVSPTNTLDLKHKNSTVKIASNVLEKQEQSYENIKINRYKIKRAQRVLFYEHIQTDINWEFIYGPIYNLKYIFNGTKANIIYQSSNLTFVQLKISKDRYINILAESSGFKDFSYVYGFSNEEFRLVIDQVLNDNEYAEKLMYNVTVLDERMPPLSQWSVIKLLLNPFLKPDVRSVSGF
ncbi:MAG: hypothetical protein H8E76_03355 [Helicobacteraceae bacterium]|nr:hypothetical protein [Candidatus Sulfurimonas ponti]MBL6973682.1 hypothetical protein [Sulfurimonas sp.]